MIARPIALPWIRAVRHRGDDLRCASVPHGRCALVGARRVRRARAPGECDPLPCDYLARAVTSMAASPVS